VFTLAVFYMHARHMFHALKYI